jgi:8-oxo-dGTP diphosphatase
VWEGDLFLFGVFGERGRDPRGWTVSCVYLAELQGDEAVAAADDAADARWFPVLSLPQMAFDHREVIAAALEFL